MLVLFPWPSSLWLYAEGAARCEGWEDRETWQLIPLFVLLPCHRVDLARGQKQWCLLATLMAGSSIHLALLAPWSHHPTVATTLCPRRGCLWASWLCQAVGQRGETTPKDCAVLDPDDRVLTAAKTHVEQCTDPETRQQGQVE